MSWAKHRDAIYERLNKENFAKVNKYPLRFTKVIGGMVTGVDIETEEVFFMIENERVLEDDGDTLDTIKSWIDEVVPGELVDVNADYDVVDDTDPAQNVPAETMPAVRGAPVMHEEPELTVEMIRKYINPDATVQEAYMFLRLCQARDLNPFVNEAYLIKYSKNSEATMVVGKDAFIRKAEEQPEFDGFEAGIIIENEKQEIERREGAFMTDDEILLGGWAKVYRKDIGRPFVSEVSFSEYEGKKSDGSPNKQWRSKPCTMIRKVPLVQAIREAFTGSVSGMYDIAEMGVELPAMKSVAQIDQEQIEGGK